MRSTRPPPHASGSLRPALRADSEACQRFVSAFGEDLAGVLGNLVEVRVDEREIARPTAAQLSPSDDGYPPADPRAKSSLSQRLKRAIEHTKSQSWLRHRVAVLVARRHAEEPDRQSSGGASEPEERRAVSRLGRARTALAAQLWRASGMHSLHERLCGRGD